MSQAGIVTESTAAGADLKTLTGDTGAAVPGDAAGNVDLIGTAAQGLTFAGTPASNQIQGTIADATTIAKGVSSYATLDFGVAAGAVSLNDAVVKIITTDSGPLTPVAHGFSILGGEGMNVTHGTTIITVAGEDASDTNKGIATFLAADFGVVAGDVSLNDAVVKSVTTDSGAMTPTTHSFSILGGEGMNVTHAGAVITVTGEDASETNKGILEISTDVETNLMDAGDKALVPSNLAALFAPQQISGFQEWTGAGSYYTVAGTNFTLDRPGLGRINSILITWLGAQTIVGLAAGSTHLIYIDDTGTIGSTTTRNTALFQDNIVLFQVLVDSGGAATVITVRENHHYRINPALMETMHDIGLHGFNVTESASGGVISLDGTLGVQVDGATEWLDSDLVTDVPDSGGAAITLRIMYTDGAGKWVQDASQNTVPTEYNNAGTPTALGGNQRSVGCVFVSKDDIESAVPQYFFIMGDVLYTSLAAARTAIALNQFTLPTNELAALELVKMGYVIVNATVLDEVSSDKQTIGQGSSSSSATSANLISVDSSGFDVWLSAVDTTMQAVSDTLNDIGRDSNFYIVDDADITSRMHFDVSAIATGTDRLVTMPDLNITLGDSVSMRSQVTVPGGYIENAGITYTGSVFSVTGSSAALSATNPLYITMNSKVSLGQLKTYTVTAAQGFLDDTGASEIIGNTFGLPTGVAYAQDIPFFIYAVSNDAEDTVAFMISRVPGRVKAPLAGGIGDPSSAIVDEQWSFFSFEDITEADYASNPCIMVGSFRMRMSAADDWTVQALGFEDGIGRFQEGIKYIQPTGAFLNAAGGHLYDNGGTAPSFTTNELNYYVHKDGFVTFMCFLNGDAGADGAGAVSTELGIAYKTEPDVTLYYASGAWIRYAGTDTNSLVTVGSVRYFKFYDPEGTGTIQNADFANGTRGISFKIRVRMAIA